MANFFFHLTCACSTPPPPPGRIADVDVFSMCPKTMLIRLSFAFESQTFPPSEEIIRLQDPLRMCIIQRGVVAVFPLDKGAKGFKVKTQGRARPPAFPAACCFCFCC